MKKITLAFLSGIAIMFAVSFTKSQDKDLSIARVSKLGGKYVFLNCEPINEYTVVYELKTKKLSGFDTPNEIADFVLKAARKEESKNNKEFDAIVIGSGTVDLAIKFKE